MIEELQMLWYVIIVQIDSTENLCINRSIGKEKRKFLEELETEKSNKRV